MEYEQGTILFIANPKSGATSRQRVPKQFHDFLLARGLKVNLIPTAAAGHACDLARQAYATYAATGSAASGLANEAPEVMADAWRVARDSDPTRRVCEEIDEIAGGDPP